MPKLSAAKQLQLLNLVTNVQLAIIFDKVRLLLRRSK
jgi:hypothetical protein